MYEFLAIVACTYSDSNILLALFRITTLSAIVVDVDLDLDLDRQFVVIVVAHYLDLLLVVDLVTLVVGQSREVPMARNADLDRRLLDVPVKSPLVRREVNPEAVTAIVKMTSEDDWNMEATG